MVAVGYKVARVYRLYLCVLRYINYYLDLPWIAVKEYVLDASAGPSYLQVLIPEFV